MKAKKKSPDSLVPQLFSSEDKEVIETLKSSTEQILMLRQEATNQLDKISNITGNIASIAASKAKIRQSDNNVLIASQRIAADTEKFHATLSSIFSGRDKAIDAFIAQIENGVKSGNDEIILKAMDGLATIVASSPWPNFESFYKLIQSDEEIVL